MSKKLTHISIDSLFPSHWDKKTIKEVGKIVTGRTPSTKQPEYWNGEIPFITPPDLQGTFIRDVIRSITKKGLKVSRPLPKGTVLVSCIGYIGKVGIVTNECAVTNQQINAVIPNSEVDTLFLAYLIQHIRPLLNGLASVTTVPILNKTNFEAITIRIPDLSEQQTIARILRNIQKAKEVTEKVIAASKTLKQSIMRHLFTYGPVPFHKTDKVDLQDTKIGQIPIHWQQFPFDEIATFKNGMNFRADQKGRGVLMVDVFNMYRGGNSVEMQNLYRVDIKLNDAYRLQNNDLLFVRSSLKREGVGWASLFPGYTEPVSFCGFLIRARLSCNDIDPEFLVNYFRLPSVREAMVSKSGKVAITNISQGNLRAFPIFLPPLDEQRKITEIIRILDNKIISEENRRDALKILFNTMLHLLLTGQVPAHDI